MQVHYGESRRDRLPESGIGQSHILLNLFVILQSHDLMYAYRDTFDLTAKYGFDPPTPFQFVEYVQIARSFFPRIAATAELEDFRKAAIKEGYVRMTCDQNSYRTTTSLRVSMRDVLNDLLLDLRSDIGKKDQRTLESFIL